MKSGIIAFGALLGTLANATLHADSVQPYNVAKYTSYAVGGTVGGLTGTVVLQNSGGDDLPISADGSFMFTTAVTQGNPYNVTVLTQPNAQTCSVTNGSGTMGAANVTSVEIHCVSSTAALSVDTTATIPIDGGSGTLVVTNIGNTFTAYNVAASLPAEWTDVTQDSSDCAAVAPGNTCTIYFTSAIPYIAQGNIVVTGDNVSSPPTTALAFTTQGYLIYAIDPDNMVRVIDDADLPDAAWSYSVSELGAFSPTDGFENTESIVQTIGYTFPPYAALACAYRPDFGYRWYLPAVCEWSPASPGCLTSGTPSIYTNLVALGFGPITNKQYWSSTERTDASGDSAWMVELSTTASGVKEDYLSVRCAKKVSY